MGDFGLLGWMLPRELRLPLVLAWHTNVHEYAAWRSEGVAAVLPSGTRRAIAGLIERFALRASISFCRKGTVALSPTVELVELLRQGTRKPAFLMERGVDTELFNPSKRTRDHNEVVFGYVGRLGSEKNLRLLKLVEDALLSAGIRDSRFEVIGHGAERTWLQNHLQRCRLPGVLLGEELARSYADMDVFRFPSRTDTYGNVIWEASASGVPAVVSDRGASAHRAGSSDRSCEPFGRGVRPQRSQALPRSGLEDLLGSYGAPGGTQAVLGRRVRQTVRRSLPDRGRGLARPAIALTRWPRKLRFRLPAWTRARRTASDRP